MLMNFYEFVERIQNSITSGLIFQNPGGGVSEVVGTKGERISYIRGASTISVSLADLFYAYQKFRGTRESSVMLREFAPAVFDSHARPAGQSCNCTFFLSA